MRDILKGEDEQVAAVVEVISTTSPDVLLLTGIDFDHGNAALGALNAHLAATGTPYPHIYSRRPNSGLATGLDLDRNGRTGEPRDAQGYGRFAGHGGMAILSRWPIAKDRVQDLSGLLWSDIPGATLPRTVHGEPFLSAEAVQIQRLSSVGHWSVPVELQGGHLLTLLAFSATPPLFDGEEDRNGLRNADEIRLWQVLLDGQLDTPPPESPFVVLGNANLDPLDGDGRRAAIRALLQDPRLQDPAPGSQGGRMAASLGHIGDAALDTADWSEPETGGPGNLRVDYVLPSATIPVADAGVYWPSDGAGLDRARLASRHRLVWVDLVLDR